MKKVGKSCTCTCTCSHVNHGNMGLFQKHTIHHQTLIKFILALRCLFWCTYLSQGDIYLELLLQFFATFHLFVDYPSGVDSRYSLGKIADSGGSKSACKIKNALRKIFTYRTSGLQLTGLLQVLSFIHLLNTYFLLSFPFCNPTVKESINKC